MAQTFDFRDGHPYVLQRFDGEFITDVEHDPALRTLPLRFDSNLNAFILVQQAIVGDEKAFGALVDVYGRFTSGSRLCSRVRLRCQSRHLRSSGRPLRLLARDDGVR